MNMPTWVHLLRGLWTARSAAQCPFLHATHAVMGRWPRGIPASVWEEYIMYVVQEHKSTLSIANLANSVLCGNTKTVMTSLGTCSVQLYYAHAHCKLPSRNGGNPQKVGLFCGPGPASVEGVRTTDIGRWVGDLQYLKENSPPQSRP